MVNSLRILFLSLFLPAISYGAAMLLWNPSTTSNVTYTLKWGTNSGNYISFSALGKTTNTMILTNGPWGRYFFVVSAITSNGVESLPSNELLYTNRPEAPLQLRMIEGTNVVILEGTVNMGLVWKRLAIFTNDPILLAQQKAQMVRTVSTNYPPLP